MDYQYDVTYGFNGEVGAFARSPASARWLDTRLQARHERGAGGQGHIPGPLVFGIDDQNPRAGLNDGGLGERFSNGWGDAAHVPTILIENHSLKPYEQRVLGTYVFLEESLRLLADQVAPPARRHRRRPRPASRPKSSANFESDPVPHQTRAFKGILYETYDSPASGRTEIRWLGRAGPGALATALLRLARRPAPAAPDRLLGPRLPHRPDRAAAHPRPDDGDAGRAAHRLGRDAASRQPDPRHPRQRGPRPGHGHRRHGRAPRLDLSPPARSASRPTSRSATSPSCCWSRSRRESFFAWGLFPEVLSRVEYIEGYAIAPLAEAMMAADPGPEGRVRGQAGRRARLRRQRRRAFGVVLRANSVL